MFVRQATNTLGIEGPALLGSQFSECCDDQILHFVPHSVHRRQGNPRVWARASDFIRNVDALSKFAQNILLRGPVIC